MPDTPTNPADGPTDDPTTNALLEDHGNECFANGHHDGYQDGRTDGELIERARIRRIVEDCTTIEDGARMCFAADLLAAIDAVHGIREHDAVGGDDCGCAKNLRLTDGTCTLHGMVDAYHDDQEGDDAR